MIPRRLWLAAIALAFCHPAIAAPKTLGVASPDGKVQLSPVQSDESLTYSLAWNGRERVGASALSLFPNPTYRLIGSDTRTVDKTWEPVWGQSGSVRDHCREMTLKLESSGVRVDLICRVYDDGVGFRFVVPGNQHSAHLRVHFISEYQLAAPAMAWFPNGESEPVGPVPFGRQNGMETPRAIRLRSSPGWRHTAEDPGGRTPTHSHPLSIRSPPGRMMPILPR